MTLTCHSKKSWPWIIKHDVDGVLRDFHGYAFNLFFNELYPEYQKYLRPTGKNISWNLAGFLDAPEDVVKAIDEKMDEVFFYDEIHTTNVFSKAKALVTETEWVEHFEELKKLYDCRIVISTHQYFPLQQRITIEWLEQHGIIYDDIIMTGHKQYFGGHFLLDDKPETVEKFNTPERVGVLFYNEEINHTKFYMERHNWNLPFPVADSLKKYREIIERYIINWN